MWGQVKFHRQLQYGRQKCTTASKTSKFFSEQENYLGFLCILFCLPSVVTSVPLLSHVISMLWPVVFMHEDWLTATKQIFIQLTYACLFLLGTTSNLFLLSSYCLSKNKQKNIEMYLMLRFLSSPSNSVQIGQQIAKLPGQKELIHNWRY